MRLLSLAGRSLPIAVSGSAAVWPHTRRANRLQRPLSARHADAVALRMRLVVATRWVSAERRRCREIPPSPPHRFAIGRRRFSPLDVAMPMPGFTAGANQSVIGLINPNRTAAARSRHPRCSPRLILPTRSAAIASSPA